MVVFRRICVFLCNIYRILKTELVRNNAVCMEILKFTFSDNLKWLDLLDLYYIVNAS